jgi:hypothetical protein
LPTRFGVASLITMCEGQAAREVAPGLGGAFYDRLRIWP